MVAERGCLFFTLPFIESDWTKLDVLARFDVAVRPTPQVQATWFGLANVEKTRALMSRWWQECSKEGFRALLDDPTGMTEHRHDQSVLSCLVKTSELRTATLPWEDLYSPWLYVRNSWVLLEPIHALRRARRPSAIDPLVSRSSLTRCRENLIRADLAFKVRKCGSRIYRALRTR